MSEETKFEKLFLKYTFSDAEKAEIAAEMAEKVTDLSRKEDELKAVKSDFKSQIDGLQANVNGAATKLTNGYEMRNIECRVERDYKKGVIRFIRTDTGEIARTKEMSHEDRQQKPFE